ncbi:MAG TPA: hypothetical protein VGV17_03000 [Bosea sp. (in: a-proteobacteria)]|jgi:hypothetical protein|uniref:hypothetical protein n=1 Tax=Bosea sp. (in: a-proteobacteria) TaxID=1871050 RepID=UPI002DDD1CE0|nr:hypothetical protein [Bosea sp. (in: a-proteobacteria)]HEV2552713.1 hypothetical protein [Bosea sp. (in: a-proteobacteria)]
MGFTPQQIGAMSLWQFMACADGYARSKDPAAAKRSNDDTLDGVEAMLDAAPDHLF